MKANKLSRAVIIGTLALGAPMAALAVESAGLDVTDQKVVEDIASQFGDSFADGQTASLVEVLRNGGDLTYQTSEPLDVDGVEGQDTDEQGNPLFVDNTVTVENMLGNGEISIALGLAEAIAGEDATMESVLGALYTEAGDGILDLRDSGLGWGPIFDQYGLTVGEVMHDLKGHDAARSDQAVAHRAQRPEHFSAANRPERPDRPERPQRPDSFELPERPGRP